MAKSQKCSLSVLRSVAFGHGGRCLSRTYRGFDALYRFLCANGHEWAATAATIIELKHWCELCEHGKFSVEELKRGAAAHNGRCQFLTYEGADKKHSWLCKKGHRFEETPNNVMQRGSWCPECEKDDRLLRIKAVAESRQGELLSTECTGVTELLHFRCKAGHEFEASAANVLRATKPRWCPICAGRKTCRLELQQMAESNGGRFLDPCYYSYSAPHHWSCREGHQFEMSAEEVLAGGWCPVCGE